MLFKHQDKKYSVIFRLGSKKYSFQKGEFETTDKEVINIIKERKEYKLGLIKLEETEVVKSEVIEIDSEIVEIQNQYKEKFGNLPANKKNDIERLKSKII